METQRTRNIVEAPVAQWIERLPSKPNGLNAVLTCTYAARRRAERAQLSTGTARGPGLSSGQAMSTPPIPSARPCRHAGTYTRAASAWVSHGSPDGVG